ncbi:uncharacterized protein LOC128345640 [Hemicordylus capensis]|uniref:uncharacterized protein LOC128345640 n=1 Tax=Hemicordylus capensis TaxID=884348 RepID=UPI0023046856|nr:uncharacterized protein LOC128345640 [Hemicordylus capensis]
MPPKKPRGKGPAPKRAPCKCPAPVLLSSSEDEGDMALAVALSRSKVLQKRGSSSLEDGVGPSRRRRGTQAKSKDVLLQELQLRLDALEAAIKHTVSAPSETVPEAEIKQEPEAIPAPEIKQEPGVARGRPLGKYGSPPYNPARGTQPASLKSQPLHPTAQVSACGPKVQLPPPSAPGGVHLPAPFVLGGYAMPPVTQAGMPGYGQGSSSASPYAAQQGQAGPCWQGALPQWGPRCCLHATLWGPVQGGVPDPRCYPYSDAPQTQGAHLHPTTKEKIWNNEYVDIFSLLFSESKTVTVDRNWSNWLSGYLVFVDVVLQRQPWRAYSLINLMYADSSSPRT